MFTNAAIKAPRIMMQDKGPYFALSKERPDLPALE
jgi:hypothetical protein